MEDSLQRQIDQIATPEGGGDFMAFILRRRWLMTTVARSLAAIGKMSKKPLRLGKTIFVTRHSHVVEALKRDTDFLAAGSYADEIERTNGPFVLGMDRGPQHNKESSALYSALSRLNLKHYTKLAEAEADRLLEANGSSFDAVQDYLWPVCGYTTQAMFGLSHIDPLLFRQVSRSIFFHVFLDAAKAKDVRRRAVESGELISKWLADEIARRREAGPGEYGEDFVGQLLLEGSLDDDAIRRTLGGVLVGSIDTINGVAARVLEVARKKPKLGQRMLENKDQPHLLNGYCLEAHRVWAQTPMIVRSVAHETLLGGAKLRPAQKLLLFTHAAMFDASAFNKPLTLRPDRPQSSYLHYGMGMHACSGRVLADMQVPMLVKKLIERNYQLDGKMKWAGPFPHRLPIRL